MKRRVVLRTLVFGGTLGALLLVAAWAGASNNALEPPTARSDSGELKAFRVRRLSVGARLHLIWPV